MGGHGLDLSCWAQGQIEGGCKHGGQLLISIKRGKIFQHIVFPWNYFVLYSGSVLYFVELLCVIFRTRAILCGITLCFIQDPCYTLWNYFMLYSGPVLYFVELLCVIFRTRAILCFFTTALLFKIHIFYMFCVELLNIAIFVFYIPRCRTGLMQSIHVPGIGKSWLPTAFKILSVSEECSIILRLDMLQITLKWIT
jgi:hypothetical protein